MRVRAQCYQGPCFINSPEAPHEGVFSSTFVKENEQFEHPYWTLLTSHPTFKSQCPGRTRRKVFNVKNRTNTKQVTTLRPVVGVLLLMCQLTHTLPGGAYRRKSEPQSWES